MTKIRLGTCSPAATESPRASLALIEKIARRAAVQGIDLLLLPEAFLGSGYPRGVSFASVLGAGNAAGREAFLDYFKRAVDFGDVVGDAGAGGGDAWLEKGKQTVDNGNESVRKDHIDKKDPSPGDGTREVLEKIARETGVFLVVGAVEKAGGSLYCAVVYVCPAKGMLGKRRKVQPTGLERLIWSPAGPASLRAVSTEIKGVRINLAAAICWENYMPLVRQSLYAQNVNLYLAPTTDGGDAWLSLMRTIGIEGRCFVATSNMCTTAQRKLPTAKQTLQTTAASSTEAQQSGQHSATEEQPPTAHQKSQEVNMPLTACGPVTTKIISCASTNGKPRRRKKSFVVDADGNEIVLSCRTVDEEECAAAEGLYSTNSDSNTRAPASDAPEAPPLPPFPALSVDEAWERHKHARRRSSVFDEDDNEIVLCRPPGASSKPPSVPNEQPSNKPAPVHQVPRKNAATEAKKPRAPLPTDTHGGSAIISPFGTVLAGPQWDDSDGFVVADVDFEDCIRGRLNLDVAGHYSRNDSFKLSVTGLDLSPMPY